MAAPSGGGLHIAMVAWVVAVSRVDTDGPPEAEADGHPMAQHPGTRQRHPHLARLPPTQALPCMAAPPTALAQLHPASQTGHPP